MYVGEPITTDGGTLVVGFFAQFPDGGVVDGGVLVGAVDENSDVISAAVSSSAHNVHTNPLLWNLTCTCTCTLIVRIYTCIHVLTTCHT